MKLSNQSNRQHLYSNESRLGNLYRLLSLEEHLTLTQCVVAESTLNLKQTFLSTQRAQLIRHSQMLAPQRRRWPTAPTLVASLREERARPLESHS